MGFRFGILTPQAAKSGSLECTRSPSLRELGKEHNPTLAKSRVSRGQCSAPSTILGQTGRHRRAVAGPFPSALGGTELPNSRRVRAVLQSHPGPPLLSVLPDVLTLLVFAPANTLLLQAIAMLALSLPLGLKPVLGGLTPSRSPSHFRPSYKSA